MLQLLLDLFGDARAEPAPTPVAAPESESNRPSALEQPAPTAIQNIANQPLVQLPDALPAAQFVHPRASRSIRFAHAEVAYEFRRGKRRTIGFQVGPEGLTVSAPRWTPLGEVEAALREKERWVVTKLRESQERQARLESARIEWREGAELPFLGEPEDMANIVAFLASDDARYLTGHVIRADGGTTSHLPTYADARRFYDGA